MGSPLILKRVSRFLSTGENPGTYSLNSYIFHIVLKSLVKVDFRNSLILRRQDSYHDETEGNPETQPSVQLSNGHSTWKLETSPLFDHKIVENALKSYGIRLTL